MPKYTINGKTYSSPTPLSDDDLMELAGEAPAQPKAPTMMDKLGRQVGLAGRYLLEGGEQALTYPVRAAAEAVSGGLNLAGQPEMANSVSRTLGMKGNGGKVVADAIGLPNPEGKLEQGVAGASKMLTGLGAGGILNRVAAGAPATTQAAVNALVPGTNSATEAAIASGIGAGMEVAPTETASTLATIAALRGGKTAYNGAANWNAERKLLGKSATPEADAQVVLDLARLKKDPIRFQQVIQDQAAVGRSNAVGIGTDYKDKVASLLKQSGKSTVELDDLLNKKNITSDDVSNLLGGSEEAKAVAASLLLSTRADAMTKPAVSNALLSPVRAAVDFVAPKWIAQPVNAALGGRATGEANINKLVNPRNVEVAENFLAKNRSPVNDINQFENSVQRGILADTAAAEAAAQKAAAEAATQAGALKEANIAGMRMNRAPAGGAFQSLKEYTGLADDQIVDSLRALSNHPTLGKYADQLRKGGNTDNGALFAVQNAINGLQKRQGGILNQANPGALYQGQNVTVEGIRNPVSYAANVKNAEEAVKIARESAFSPELGQFATSVAGTKSPADKLALIKDRLSKTTDPAEIDYINKFVLPLANFGKK